MKTTAWCLLALACAGAAEGSADDDRKKPVPFYTNDDLQRVSPYRDQTGVNSTSVAAEGEAPASPGRVRAEAYWRREAERLRDRLRPLRERAAELRLRIEERRRQPPRRGMIADPQRVTMERRLQLLEERIRDAESRFEDRARRESALPGWLR